MIGSLGLCPSGNIGERHALFEPAHGSAPDIAGKGVGRQQVLSISLWWCLIDFAANPASQILSGVMMLAHLGEHEAAAKLQNALRQSFADGVLPVRTLASISCHQRCLICAFQLDLGGKAHTKDVVEAVISRI